MEAVPDEILHQIFAELEGQLPLEKWHLYGAQLDHQGSAALRNLCLVCRQFRRIAQPLLYQTVVIEGRKGAKKIEILLLRTLVENPQLGEQVRVVSVTDNVDDSAQVSILGEDTSMEIIQSAMESLDLPPGLKSFMRSIIPRCGFAALVIAYMPHVQVVDCTIDHRATPLLWLLSASAAFTKANGFPYYNGHLITWGYGQDKDIEDQEEDQGISTSTFANYCFLNLAEAQDTTDIGTACFGDRIPSLENPQEKNYTLKYLDLMDTCIDSKGLMTILTCCPKLKGISICFPGEREKPWDHDYDDFILSFDAFGTVLREHRQNLEEFDLNTLFYEETWSAGEGRIGSLQELKSLRHIKLTKDSLIGMPGHYEAILRLSEVLSELTETLSLYWDGRCQMAYWVQYHREPYNQEVYNLLLDGMPNLREIRMERMMDCNDDSDED